jgi:hypothetical protein
MAGDWIKMRTNLLDDPRVLRMCDLTECTETQIVGGLYWLWSAADSHTETGLMPGLTLPAIDRKTGVKGFAAALIQVGWISETPQGIEIVRFDEHNGASAKKRATTAKRVQKHKSKAAGNATSVTQNGTSADSGNAQALAERYLEKEKRREEKIQEEKSGAAKPLDDESSSEEQGRKPRFDAKKMNFPAELDTPEFRIVWSNWIDFRRKQNFPRNQDWAEQQLAELAFYGPVVSINALSDSMIQGWQGVFPGKARYRDGPSKSQGDGKFSGLSQWAAIHGANDDTS